MSLIILREWDTELFCSTCGLVFNTDSLTENNMVKSPIGLVAKCPGCNYCIYQERP